jgi:hypothetical protein
LEWRNEKLRKGIEHRYRKGVRWDNGGLETIEILRKLVFGTKE